MNHPEFANRPNTTVLNEQTTDDEDEDHGTEVSSVVAAPVNGIGVVGVYPQAVLRVWDASPFGFLNEGAAIEGIMEAARRGPGRAQPQLRRRGRRSAAGRGDHVRVPHRLR